MKRFLFVSAIVLWLASESAQAYPTHTFLCVIRQNGVAKQQIYFSIEASDLKSGAGFVTLSNWSAPRGDGQKVRMKDCGILDGPCEGVVGPRWVPFLKTPAKAQVSWSSFRGRPAIRGVGLDLGRQGRLNAFVSAPWDEFGSARGRVVSDVRGFNYLSGVDADSCAYFNILGSKPGMTGSN